MERKMPPVPAWVAEDRQWLATVHILYSPALARKAVGQWVDFKERSIYFEDMYDAAAEWSRGERVLIQIAWDFFNGNGNAAMMYLVTDLDDANLDLVLDGIYLLRG